MSPSLRSLLSQIIDYAGMFPPARLPLEEALRNYTASRRGDHAWMLSRFVCGVSILQEIDLHAPMLFEDGARPWRIAAIGRGGDGMLSFLEGLQRDLAVIAAFAKQRKGCAFADALEVKIPPAVIRGGSEEVRELVERSAEAIAIGAPGVMPFYEIEFGATSPEAVSETLNVLKRFNAKWAGQRYRPAGAKIRTGGLEAEAFPSTKQLAFFISVCSKLGLAFKATAGLHHPLRRHDKSVGTKMHGFLNVFVAAALAHALQSDLQTLVRVLESEKVDEFTFEDDGLSWCGKKVSLDQIAAARKHIAVSYGSCSFDEPIEGLKKLGLT